MGNRHDYRRAKIRKSERSPSNEADVGEHADGRDGSRDEYDRSYEARGWPSRANHDEDAFGVAFDAGGHRLREFNPDHPCIVLGLRFGS